MSAAFENAPSRAAKFEIMTKIHTGRLFRPIKLERVSEKAALQIKEAVISGLFKVGTRLPPERELAQQMGVSRPSIREAIHRLEILGLLESVHGGGTVVRSLTEKEIQRPMEMVLGENVCKVVELSEIRGFMEAWAAKMAAVNRTDADLAGLRQCLEESEHDLANGRINAELDLKFHTEIAAAAHNAIFLHLMQTIHRLIAFSVRLSREVLFPSNEDQETIFMHHLQIFKAIQLHDNEMAELTMSRHILFVKNEYRRKFFSDPQNRT